MIDQILMCIIGIAIGLSGFFNSRRAAISMRAYQEWYWRTLMHSDREIPSQNVFELLIRISAAIVSIGASVGLVRLIFWGY